MASTPNQSTDTPSQEKSRRNRVARPSRGEASESWLSNLDAVLNDDTNTDIEVLKTRLREQLETARVALSDAANTATGAANSYVHNAADCIDDYVTTKPWRAIVYAAGTAFLLGAILGRK